MHTGHYISGAGHLGLIGWLLLGGLFQRDVEPFEISEVSVITGAQFEALLAAQQPPSQVTEVAQPLEPQVTPDVPDVSASSDTAIEQPTPIQADPPADDPAPDAVEEPLPPQTEVEDAPPELEQPVGDVAVLVPETAPEAVPRPVERVAPEPVALPDPDASPDPVEQQAVSPDATGETTEPEAQEATAPEAATTEIVTEATAAPKASVRPPGRRPAAPSRQTATAPEPAEEPTEDQNADAIAAAVAAAQTEAPATAPSAVGGLNENEIAALIKRVGREWNVDAGSRSAAVTVIVSIELAENGRLSSSPRLVSSDSNDAAIVDAAFRRARTAIIAASRNGGFELPIEKYDDWKQIEITFNPQNMRVK